MPAGGTSESSPAAALDGGRVLIGRAGRVVAVVAVAVVVHAGRTVLFSGVFAAGDPWMEWPFAWQRQQSRGWKQRQDGTNRRSDEKATRETER